MSLSSKRPPRTESHPALIAYRKRLDSVETKTSEALANLDSGLNKLLEEYLDDAGDEQHEERPSQQHHG